jgi:tryptophan synthase alpha chain
MTLAETFSRLRSRRELALMPYVMGGYPDQPRSLEIMRQVARSGADLIEIGVPFSDPVADGLTIQAASQIALQSGFHLRELLASLADEPLGCPAVLMSYLNPLLAYGRDALINALLRAELAGLIIPDLPFEEADEWLAAARDRNLTIVFLAAPTSSDERLRRIAQASDSFIYAVSVAGTTGVRDQTDRGLPEYLARLRRVTDKPIAVGFGISQPEHVRALRGLADGAVIGSRLVQAIERHEDLTALLQSFKRATRGEPCSS